MKRQNIKNSTWITAWLCAKKILTEMVKNWYVSTLSNLLLIPKNLDEDFRQGTEPKSPESRSTLFTKSLKFEFEKPEKRI
jgi:hypothetical protein